MKKIIIAIFLFLSFTANAQRTNESEFVITKLKINGEENEHSYTDGNGRIKLYKENGIDHLDVYDCCGWTMHGILENNNIPNVDLPPLPNRFRMITLNKTWKSISTVDGKTHPMAINEIVFQVIFRTNKTFMTFSINGETMKYYGIFVPKS